MQSTTLIDYIVKGDLKQTSLSDIGTEESRTANPEQQNNLDTLVGFLNQGMLEQHKRFPIKVDIAELDLDDAFTVNNTLGEPLILPIEALELIEVLTNTLEAIPVDDAQKELEHKIGNYKGMFVKTISVNTYTVHGDKPPRGVYLLFKYKAAPVAIKYGQLVNLPSAYQECLLNYMAYRGYSTVKSVTQAGDEGFNYKKRFEDSVLHLKEITDSLYEPSYTQRLWDRGFV
jgi:hypothetical protein